MAQTPLTVNIDLQDIVQLLNYYWSAVSSQEVGDVGTTCYDETMINIARRSQIKVTPEELENLVYHTKQAIFEKLKPRNIDLRQKNYHKIMKRLSDSIPQLFKETPTGEIVFVNFQDREAN